MSIAIRQFGLHRAMKSSKWTYSPFQPHCCPFSFIYSPFQPYLLSLSFIHLIKQTRAVDRLQLEVLDRERSALEAATRADEAAARAAAANAAGSCDRMRLGKSSSTESKAKYSKTRNQSIIHFHHTHSTFFEYFSDWDFRNQMWKIFLSTIQACYLLAI
jgi:hypothetical protein